MLLFCLQALLMQCMGDVRKLMGLLVRDVQTPVTPGPTAEETAPPPTTPAAHSAVPPTIEEQTPAPPQVGTFYYQSVKLIVDTLQHVQYTQWCVRP